MFILWLLIAPSTTLCYLRFSVIQFMKHKQKMEQHWWNFEQRDKLIRVLFEEDNLVALNCMNLRTSGQWRQENLIILQYLIFIQCSVKTFK